MKTGDKVYCIKNYLTRPSKIFQKSIYFQKGKLYKIHEIVDFYNNKNERPVNAININDFMFTLKKENQESLFPRYYEYFITLSELRKQKLTKISQTR